MPLSTSAVGSGHVSECRKSARACSSAWSAFDELIVQWLSWRDFFFVNVPVGLAALCFGWRHMPDYRGRHTRPLDWRGFVLGSGTALLSWLLEVFGEHGLSAQQALGPLLLSWLLIAAYVWRARGAGPAVR